MADVTFPAVTVRSRTPTSCHLPANHTCLHLESHPGWAFDGACARRPHQLLEHKAPVACGQHAEFTRATRAGGADRGDSTGVTHTRPGHREGVGSPLLGSVLLQGSPWTSSLSHSTLSRTDLEWRAQGA